MPISSSLKWLEEYFIHPKRTQEGRSIGIEIERIAVWPDGSPLQYHADTDPQGIARPGAEKILRELHARHGWELVDNGAGEPLGMNSPYGKVSLEPGNQLELSGHPVANLCQLIQSVCEFEKRVSEITKPWGLTWISLGLNPTSSVSQVELIPSPRYQIMSDFFPRRGKLGTSMMRLTSSIQINLDYQSEVEAVDMLRVALAAAPISYALFANSPFYEGKQTGFLSYRNEIWRNTDPDRSGLLPQVFHSDFSLTQYAKIVHQLPLMFALNNQGQYVAANGFSLAQIEKGMLPGVEASVENCESAVRQLFTEARLKSGYVEVRSIDGLGVSERTAAAAFWMGVLYCEKARALVLSKLAPLSGEERQELLKKASELGLNTPFQKSTLKELALSLVQHATDFLKARKLGEEKLLHPIFDILQTGKNPAQKALLNSQTPDLIRWSGQEANQVLKPCSL